MVSSIPTSHKSIEEKKRPSNSDTYQSWSRLFREQNKAVIKPTVSLSGLKSSKHDSETKETKKHFSNRQKLDVSINSCIHIHIICTRQFKN